METSGAGGQARRGHRPGLSLLIQALASGPPPSLPPGDQPPRLPLTSCGHLFDLRVARRPHRSTRSRRMREGVGPAPARKHGCEQGQELEDASRLKLLWE